MTTNDAPTKRQVTKHGQERWELDFGEDDTGKRIRRLFKTEADADNASDAHRKEKKSGGDYWARLTAVERSAVVAILQQIQSKGLKLGRVWEDYQRWSVEAHKQSVETPIAYSLAIEEFKRRKLAAGNTERYVNNTCDVLMKFGQGREEQNIHEILPAELERWLDNEAETREWSGSTKHTYILLFSSLWSVAKDKGWATLNITDRLEPVKVITPDVRIFKHDVVRNFLAAMLSNELTRRIVAPIALGFFGCMRPEEVASVKALDAGMTGKKLFGWHDIDLKTARCTVRPDIAKTGDQRTIRLQPVAVEWLKLAKEYKNPLPPVNERKLTDQVCAMIGLEDWIRDGMRKTCATHLRAVYKQDYDVIRDCGNSIAVLLKHYAELNTPEEVSLEHWKLTPDAIREYMKTPGWAKIVSGEQPERTANET
jgi:integrase